MMVVYHIKCFFLLFYISISTNYAKLEQAAEDSKEWSNNTWDNVYVLSS